MRKNQGEGEDLNQYELMKNRVPSLTRKVLRTFDNERGPKKEKKKLEQEPAEKKKKKGITNR